MPRILVPSTILTYQKAIRHLPTMIPFHQHRVKLMKIMEIIIPTSWHLVLHMQIKKCNLQLWKVEETVKIQISTCNQTTQTISEQELIGIRANKQKKNLLVQSRNTKIKQNCPWNKRRQKQISLFKNKRHSSRMNRKYAGSVLEMRTKVKILWFPHVSVLAQWVIFTWNAYESGSTPRDLKKKENVSKLIAGKPWSASSARQDSLDKSILMGLLLPMMRS